MKEISLDQRQPGHVREPFAMQRDNRRQIENLQKLFPLAVRNPWLVPMLPRLIRLHWMYRPYLILFMLHAEYLVAEQAMIYANAQGLSGPRYWTWVDYLHRLSTKGVLRAYNVLLAKHVERFSNFGTQAKVALQMGDERVVAQPSVSAPSRDPTRPRNASRPPSETSRIRRYSKGRTIRPVR